jgi:hypothetical protein
MQGLHDFLADIMSIVSLDAKSSKTFAQIEKAISEIMEMEKKIAEIMKNNGYQEGSPEKPPKLDKRKFNDLNSVVSAVSLHFKFKFRLLFRSTGRNYIKRIHV